MKAAPQINQQLNQILKNELTAINQYFLHARMYKNWGLNELDEHEYKASIQAMKNADTLIERILFLEGLPNLQDLGKLLIGEDASEIIKSDYQMEITYRNDMLDAISLCESEQDYVSREMLDRMLADKEEQIDWLETQSSLIETTGLANYLQSAMS